MRAIYDVNKGRLEVDRDWRPELDDTLPPPLPPPPITRRQLRLWLVRHGYALAQVEAAIDKLPEPQRTEARIEWEDASFYDARNPLLVQLAREVLGLSGEALDAAFKEAAAY